MTIVQKMWNQNNGFPPPFNQNQQQYLNQNGQFIQQPQQPQLVQAPNQFIQPVFQQPQQTHFIQNQPIIIQNQIQQQPVIIQQPQMIIQPQYRGFMPVMNTQVS